MGSFPLVQVIRREMEQHGLTLMRALEYGERGDRALLAGYGPDQQSLSVVMLQSAQGPGLRSTLRIETHFLDGLEACNAFIESVMQWPQAEHEWADVCLAVVLRAAVAILGLHQIVPWEIPDTAVVRWNYE